MPGNAKITPMGFGLRWFVAILLVMSTYNPAKVDYVAWVTSDGEAIPFKILVGGLLLIGYGIYIRATLSSIGRFWTLVLIVMFGALYWFLVDTLGDSVTSGAFVGWFAIVSLATILTIGLCWSFVRQFLSGQYDAT